MYERVGAACSSWARALLAVAPVGARAPPRPEVDEVVEFIRSESLAEPHAGLLLCLFGFGRHTAELSRQILEEFAPPRFRAHVAFLHRPPKAQGDIAELLDAFPERAHAPESIEAFGTRCSMMLLSVEDPRFNAEAIRKAADGATAILGHIGTDCTSTRHHACRFFNTAWDSILAAAGTAARCSRHFCTAIVPTAGLDDPWLSNLDCAALLSPGRPPSTTSQWQQDWFVYHNFVRGTELDGRPPALGQEAEAEAEGGAAEDSAGALPRQGVFVDVGAFHPIHLSNTFFFERCLGWRGLCAEPNPNWAPYFGAYRQSCQLVPNCVWSRPRSVVMSYQKDPIEAYIQEDSGAGGGAEGGSSGAVLIQGNGTRPKFEAVCRTLEDILSSAGLRRPATIDYMSVDAEAAEVEIFRGFPFREFDISVVSVEVQAQNYYELDTIFMSAGYAKLAVLGGDHVYAKLRRGLIPPRGAAEWHRTIARDFHAHAPPRSELGRGR